MSHKDFLTTVRQFISARHLFDTDKSVLAAVSGGADSVALLLVLRQMGCHVMAAHCNFGLRGAESDSDEQFVVELCRELQVQLSVVRFDVPSYVKEHGVSTEMACRDLRYSWFQELAAKHDCQAVAVAHHRDDNVETFMLNALRGTGIAGLRGMRPRGNQAVPVVRPFLCVGRSDILDFLSEQKQHYVTDSSNLVSDVKRNRLRNVVLPVLRQEFPDAYDRLADTVQHVAHDEALLNELVQKAAHGMIVKRGNGFDIDLKELAGFANAAEMLFCILKPHGFSFPKCEAILCSVGSGNAVGKLFSASTNILSVGRGKLEVFTSAQQLQPIYAVDFAQDCITIPVSIKIQRISGQKFKPGMCNGRTTVALNAGVLQAKHVELRHWQHGDRFAPFGMKGTKLVSDLFTDLKLGQREKREAWLLVADGKILWVLGCRASREFRVPCGAADFLLLTFNG